MISGSIERLGLSDYAKLLADKSCLKPHEIPVAEITTQLNEEVEMPGWLIFDCSTYEFSTVHPAGQSRFDLELQFEAGFEMLSTLYTRSIH